MSAASSLTELEAFDRDHLDTGLSHLRDRVGVALVGHNHAGLQRYDVVTVVPLLSLLLIDVATGLDDVQFGDAQCIGDCAEEVRLLGYVESSRGIPGTETDGSDVFDDLRVGRCLVPDREG